MDNTRRTFLQITAAAALSAPVTAQTRAGGKQPWYLRTYRWGQTNITEQDPIQYDIAWWRDYWKRTEVQGVIVNAGGIVAYYPSKFPLQYRAQFLNGRDLYGELSGGGASRRAGGDGADGFQSHRRGLLSGPPHVVRAHGRRQALPRGR